MKQIILNLNGDKIETKYYQSIQEKLGGYEEIWKIYIGHDGNGQMLEVEGLSEEENKNRKITGKLNYTILTSLVGLLKTIEDYKNYTFNEDAFERYDGDIVKTLGLIGRIRDNIQDLFNLFFKDNSKKLILDMEQFFEERNQVLHNVRLGFVILNGKLMIPKTETNIQPFKNSVDWKDLAPEDCIDFYDYLTDTTEKLFKIANSCFYKILPEIKKIIRTSNMQFINTYQSANTFAASGVMSYPPFNSEYKYKATLVSVNHTIKKNRKSKWKPT